jgi:hypothetical protein
LVTLRNEMKGRAAGSFQGAKLLRMLPSDFMRGSPVRKAARGVTVRFFDVSGGGPAGDARTAYWPVTILVQLRVSRRWLRWS